MPAYYNEIDPYAAQWLRNLIAAGHIAPGDVDERSIVDVRADDLRGYRQCHFFAGIGVWSYAMRLAGWPDDEEVWTGSCPCQSFSAAGGRRGFDDERHLWPHWYGLIGERGPRTVFGEQVASQDGLAWLDFVCADMEAKGYAIAALDLCAAGFGAPHIRQRLFFVAEPESEQQSRRPRPGGSASEVRHAGSIGASSPGRSRGVGGMEHSGCAGQDERQSSGQQQIRYERGAGCGSMADTDERGCEVTCLPVRPARQDQAEAVERGASFWSAADWIPCADGKARPVEPGTFPLAHGIARRMDKLRAYGNAINAEVARHFIESYRECLNRSTPP